MIAHLHKHWCVWARADAIARHSLAGDDVIQNSFWLIPKIKSANLSKPIPDITNYSTSICPFESEKCGKEGRTGWSAVLEFLELFLSCKWFLKNSWNNEFLRICSWNVLEFYFSSFIKNSTHLFHDSSFWNRCLYIGSRYYFVMVRLS